MVNGKPDYTKAGPDSYISLAKNENASYFDLGSEWNDLKSQHSLTDDDLFDAFNVPALDDAVNSGKQIKFSHDPRVHGGMLELEWEHLQKTHNFKRLTETDGFWYAK